MLTFLRKIFGRSPPPSQFDLALASILLRDAHRQSIDNRAPAVPPPKPIGLRKVLADLS
jgi:hypothetical protein